MDGCRRNKITRNNTRVFFSLCAPPLSHYSTPFSRSKASSQTSASSSPGAPSWFSFRGAGLTRLQAAGVSIKTKKKKKGESSYRRTWTQSSPEQRVEVGDINRQSGWGCSCFVSIASLTSTTTFSPPLPKKWGKKGWNLNLYFTILTPALADTKPSQKQCLNRSIKIIRKERTSRRCFYEKSLSMWAFFPLTVLYAASHVSVFPIWCCYIYTHIFIFRHRLNTNQTDSSTPTQLLSTSEGWDRFEAKNRAEDPLMPFKSKVALPCPKCVSV